MKKLAMVLVCAMFLSTPAFAGETLDLDNPKDAVLAMQKIVCHTEEGKPATYWWTGKVYSRVPGEKDRLLFKYQP